MRGAAHDLFRAAERGALDSESVSSFARELRSEAEGVTVDDVEWFGVLAVVAGRLEESSRASDFGTPHGPWREWGIPFDKVRKLYADMERTGAVESVTWYHGGFADVQAHDVRPIRTFLERQVQMRLRSMGVQPPGADAPTTWRRIGSRALERLWPIAAGVIIVVLGAWLTVLLVGG